MELGANSTSLAVKDLAASQAFYAHLGFQQIGGDPSQHWLILRNGDTTIGLFQGMFEQNILTFNPGWDSGGKALASFQDVRAIQAELQAAGVELTTTADPDGTGPASIAMLDPDGNPVLIDQHVEAPGTATADPAAQVPALEAEIAAKCAELAALRRLTPGTAVPNYSFSTAAGDTTLLDLFAGKEQLLVVHNMGQGCRFCTLWADGFNGLLPHLEDAMAVVLVSKDAPATQRRFALGRGWRFRMASHGGGAYIQEQSVVPGAGNMPGAVVYQRQGDKILRRNSCAFGPGDLYCAMWPLLALAGKSEEDWVPRFNYWQPPAAMDDGMPPE